MPPSIIAVIAMLRKERNWPYELARDGAIEMFKQKKWPIPESIEHLYGRDTHADTRKEDR